MGHDGAVDFARLHEIDDVAALDVSGLRGRRAPHKRLSAPIGVTACGTPLVLDLKPAIDGGDGPHGLVYGSIGSGKSELLQSIVLGLAVQNAPEEVNFLLAQSMGDDTIHSIRSLPHVAGYFPNFDCDDENPELGKHLLDTIANELFRRVEHLDSCGPFDTFTEYLWAMKAAGWSNDSIPALVVVIDEFAMLARTYGRYFSDLVAAVGRLGKLAGVHLLLATRGSNPDALRVVIDYTCYRIVLKSFSRNEFREVLCVDDDVDTPTVPGEAYFRRGFGMHSHFRAAYASYPVRVAEGDNVGAPFAEALSGQLARAHRLH